MRPKTAVEVESVGPGSPAEQAGLSEGDILLSINGLQLRDVIDFMFHRSGGDTVEYLRDGAVRTAVIDADESEDTGLILRPFKVKTCRNNCIFCFVKQLPKGLRKSLYVKDEDYRLSFLYGNYVSLSNMDDRSRERIIEQRLSPLYISVHTTDTPLRNKMLGNPGAVDILKELKFFADRKIRMHTQIVLCPGYNDGNELKKTIRDLYRFFPYVMSVAVVPVGLTAHRHMPLRPVERPDALGAIELVESFQKRFMKKHGDPVVYCSDEMYIKADRGFPPLKDYGQLPQIENGVGMVPLFLSQAKKARTPGQAPPKQRFITFTGVSFQPFLSKFIDRLKSRERVALDLVTVNNDFFGRSVTVAGLLTGRDVIKTLLDHPEGHDILLVPDVALKEDEDIFLDDVTLRDVEEATGLKTVRVDSTPQGLIDTIYNCDNGERI